MSSIEFDVNSKLAADEFVFTITVTNSIFETECHFGIAKKEILQKERKSIFLKLLLGEFCFVKQTLDFNIRDIGFH